MAYSLTIAGYEFDNPPEAYRKHVTLGNTPVPHYEKGLAQFYQSDQQELQFEVEGRLSLNEQNDLDELEELQQLAIEGGEVEVEFDPFFSGKCVIEDDPFSQADNLSRYRFIMTVNEDTTDSSAYPTHATPTTGNTFKLGSFDFGYDPETVEENYERQTNTVDRLAGVSQSVDNAGLVTKVTIDGNTDGGGLKALWDKARKNELSYLDAEFQKGWALIADLSIQNNENAPDYLKGLFQFNLDLLIVSNPEGGIGEVSSFIDHDVKDSGTYVSDSDSGSYSKDAGSLSFTVSNGTGSLNGDYVAWDTTEVLLSDNATNSVYIKDDDGDGNGTVASATSGYPADTVHLFTVLTSGGEITEIDDDRAILVKENDAEPGELLNTLGLYAKLNKGSGDTTGGTTVAWVTTEVLLSANATNYVFVDSKGDIDANTSGYPTDTVHLYRLDTDADSVTTVTDDRPSDLSGSSDSSNSDLVFSEDFVIDDSAFEFARILALSDSFDLGDAGTLPWLGLVALQESIADIDDSALLPALGIASLSESVSVNDGGSASTTGGGTTSESLAWGTATDWDNATAESGIIHPSDIIELGSLEDDGDVSEFDTSDVAGSYTASTADVKRGPYSREFVSGNTSSDYEIVFHDTSAQYTPNETVFHIKVPNPQNGNWVFKLNLYSDTGSNLITAVGFDGGAQPADVSLLNANGGWESVVTTYDGTVWHKVRIVWDWANNDYDVYWDGNLVKSNKPFKNGAGGLQRWQENWDHNEGNFTGYIDHSVPPLIGNGSLSTGWKTYSADADVGSMELTNVTATLNGQSITVYVESDTNGDGTADETSDAITLDGSGGPYSVTGLSTDTDTFRLRVEPSTSDVLTTPQFNDADLKAPVGSGGDADQNPETHWTVDPGLFDTGGNEFEGGGMTLKFGG